MSETCESCRYFRPRTEGQVWYEMTSSGRTDRIPATGVKPSVCRRYPPSTAGWPQVGEDDWCGDYQEHGPTNPFEG